MRIILFFFISLTAFAELNITQPEFRPPQWTTANRPICSVLHGCLGYNLDLATFEYWDGVAWGYVGGSTDSTPIPASGNFNIPKLAFDHTLYPSIIISVTTTRVDDIPTINSNKYTLTAKYIDGTWSIVQNSIDFDTGGWDGLTFSISATGQVSATANLMLGIYDVNQSRMVYKVSLRDRI